jgi:Na+/H+ antiporter NhaD/arsenite permease-like protein
MAIWRGRAIDFERPLLWRSWTFKWKCVATAIMMSEMFTCPARSVRFFSAVASQLVSNVPLTVLMIPLLAGTRGDSMWLTVAAGTTLGGNATVIGAVANIIVVEQAHREGVRIGFVEFARVGVVVTALTIAASISILTLQYYMGLFP